MNASDRHLLRVLSCIDLTNLNEDDAPPSIDALCQSAASAPAPPAAVCVYPEYVWMARQRLDASGLTQVAVASVANFPEGGDDAARAARECRRLRSVGVDEIDVVLPYRALLAGDVARYRAVAGASREAAGACRLKCILETGELQSADLIEQAAEIALECGADFLKTSTGKVKVNASIGAAEILLNAIARSQRPCGFKAAGGIRSIDEAERYVSAVCRVLGDQAFNPARFRIGASALFERVADAIVGQSGREEESGERRY